jgi:hypothetical protein
VRLHKFNDVSAPRGVRRAKSACGSEKSAKLAGIGPHTYLRGALYTGLRGEAIALPHELA